MQYRKRCGSGRKGTQEVQDHPYFEELDFNVLQAKRYKAPWVPQMKHPLDRSNFDDYPTDETIVAYSGNQNLFVGF